MSVRSVICVHRQFERSWPYTADCWHSRWLQSGGCELIRTDAEDATRRTWCRTRPRCGGWCCWAFPSRITPHLDALAASGRRFDRCYVQSPVCVPSRFAFLTGRYCSSTGVGGNGPEFPPDLTPINQLLSGYGYHGAQIGKLHFVPHSNRDHRDPTPTYGFDTCILSDEPGCYDDAYTRWVERVDPDQLARVRAALPPAAIGVVTERRHAPARDELRHQLNVRLQHARFSARPRSARY